MAEFSKQYVEIWDPGFPWDFDIEEIAKDLHNGNYYPIICEGFGFSAIAKDRNGQILIGTAEGDYKRERYIWEHYENYILSQHRLLEEEKNGTDKIF